MMITYQKITEDSWQQIPTRNKTGVKLRLNYLSFSSGICHFQKTELIENWLKLEWAGKFLPPAFEKDSSMICEI